MDGPAWIEQKKFFMQHLRKMGLGGDVMEKHISEEVNDLMLDIRKRCEVHEYIVISIIFTNMKNIIVML